MELALIDAIGPFFRGVNRRRINWSKIPFPRLATEGAARQEQWQGIREDLLTLARKVKALGYTAVTLDDVAHLTDHPWYEEETRARIAVFRDEFRQLIELLHREGLRVFITCDYLTTTEAVDERLGRSESAAREWFREILAAFLEDYPEVEGVVLRIGESDGVDVDDPLRSRLWVRNARGVNRLLREVLPLFEAGGKTLIFRTWTVGAHLIGDLMWHRGRLARALDGLDSDRLIISMKYGESDFFRYLPLNKHFFRIGQKKIVEFQARREYEGAGEYPSFMGWEIERYARELAGAPNLVGFSVWCQTGGWHAFRRLAFLQPEGVWIELNAAVAARLLLDGATVEEAVASHLGADKAARALELLRRADVAIRDLLYISEFANRKLFFRRVRIPPLLHVYWDCLFINDPVRKLMSHFVDDPEEALREGEAAHAHFAEMVVLAEDLDLPVDDIRFMRDTFQLILLARRFYLLPRDADLEQEILTAKRAYKKRWPRSQRQRYRVRTSFQPSRMTGRTIRWLARLLVRHQRGYRRVLDQLFTLRTLSWLVLFLRVPHRKAVPKFLRKSAMGVETLFR